MMIGDREVLQTQIGENVIYRKLDYSAFRYVCPDEGQKSIDDPATYHDFIGIALMHYFPETGIGRVRTNAKFIMAAHSKPEWRLAITLPDGFEFTDGNPAQFNLWSFQSTDILAPAKYERDKMFLSVGQADWGSVATYYISNSTILNNYDLDVGFDFKIKKIKE